jgi:hypothetical protein
LPDASFDAWIADLEARHLADLEFREVSRALRALSSTYVERRDRLAAGAALGSAGKRAAFALFYAPIHYLLVGQIVGALDAARLRRGTLIDLGCGNGAASAAWARHGGAPAEILAIDVNSWALSEAGATYRHFGLRARTRRGDLTRVPWPGDAAVLAAFAVNELPGDRRDLLLARLLERSAAGSPVLVVEPIAGVRWWAAWRAGFERVGGRADEWRFRIPLPPIVARLDRAAGLDHGRLTARSLYAPGHRLGESG